MWSLRRWLGRLWRGRREDCVEEGGEGAVGGVHRGRLRAVVFRGAEKEALAVETREEREQPAERGEALAARMRALEEQVAALEASFAMWAELKQARGLQQTIRAEGAPAQKRPMTGGEEEALAKAKEEGGSTLGEAAEGRPETDLSARLERGVPRGIPGQERRRGSSRLWEGVL